MRPIPKLTLMGFATALPIGVNLRKELVCPRAIHAPLIFKEKRRVNCARTNAAILVLCVI